MTQIVGILNITPDSFSDGGKFNSTQNALNQARVLFANGADFVDVGAESTKPGSVKIDPLAEWQRMVAFWMGVTTSEDLNIDCFSLDTRNWCTAEKFFNLGGRIINDVSGFQNLKMIELAAKFKATCIVNHFPGKTVNEVHEQNIDSENKVRDDLLSSAERMIKRGVSCEKIILDPGIGFGKTPRLNQALLKFSVLVPGWPVLIGHSKKRFLGEHRFEKEPNRKAAETAMATGAAYLRVHEPEWYK